MIGAGNASASIYNSNPNLNTFGGTNREYIRKANGQGKTNLFIMNQLSGVGVGKSMFNTRFTQPRGIRDNNFILYLINNSSLGEVIPFDQFSYHFRYYGKHYGFKITETDISKMYNYIIKLSGGDKFRKSTLIEKYSLLVPREGAKITNCEINCKDANGDSGSCTGGCDCAIVWGTKLCSGTCDGLGNCDVI